MKKIVIPAVIAATILVAGVFAYMPVQKADAVHFTILAGTAQVRTVTEAAIDAAVGANAFVLTCTAPFEVLYLTIDSSDPTGDDTFAASAPTIDNDGGGALDAIPLAGGEFVSTIAAAAGSTEANTGFLTSPTVSGGGTFTETYTGVTVEVDVTVATWQFMTTNGAVCA